MGPRRSGGRAYASGGAVKSGPAWEEGVRNGSHPHNTPGKNDGKDIGRKQVVTYKTGGAVEASNTVEGASKLPGGSGGAVKDGPTWKEGVRNGTQVQHSPGKSDTANIGRSKVVTYKTGGAVEASNKVEPATKLPGGSGGARARLAKEKAYHGKPGGLYS